MKATNYFAPLSRKNYFVQCLWPEMGTVQIRGLLLAVDCFSTACSRNGAGDEKVAWFKLPFCLSEWTIALYFLRCLLLLSSRHSVSHVSVVNFYKHLYSYLIYWTHCRERCSLYTLFLRGPSFWVTRYYVPVTCHVRVMNVGWISQHIFIICSFLIVYTLCSYTFFAFGGFYWTILKEKV